MMLICVDQANYAVPNIMTDVVLEDMQGLVILAKQWMTFGGLTNLGGMSVYDWDINLTKVSRSCPKGGRLIAKFFVDSGSPQAVVLTHDLTANITQA